jgi:hypothetical protein
MKMASFGPICHPVFASSSGRFLAKFNRFELRVGTNPVTFLELKTTNLALSSLVKPYTPMELCFLLASSAFQLAMPQTLSIVMRERSRDPNLRVAGFYL